MSKDEMESLPDAMGRGDKLNVDRHLTRHREALVLRWLGEQYAGRTDHLEVLTGRTKTTVQRMTKQMRDVGWVHTRRILVGEPAWVIPTSKGLIECGLTFRESIPSSTTLAHLAAINDVRLHIQSHSAAARWVSERSLRMEGPPTKQSYVPDGLVIQEGRRVAIEVELHAKAAGLVRKKLDVLEQRYDAVLYFCAPVPWRRLTALAETGRWPNLGVRELPNPQAAERP